MYRDKSSCSFLKDLGVFIPAPMAQGMRSDFFLEGPFMPPRMKMDRDPLGGLADMFGQMPGNFEQSGGLFKRKKVSLDF